MVPVELFPAGSRLLIIAAHPDDETIKQRMLRCFTSQRRIIDALHVPEHERFRPAPQYEFRRPPAAPGRIFYEQFDWGLHGAGWCEYAEEALNVAIDEHRACDRRGPFALALGRVCPEKGYEHALDAARIAGCPLLLAGRIFPYDLHQRYFNEKIAPRLDEDRQFIGPVFGDTKRRLLQRARCVLVPSVVAETSSLVAMEALASGTPVVAFPRGALAELIEDGVTGFLVRSVAEMADAIARIDGLDRDACIATARARFSEARMVDRYVSVFHALASGATTDAS